jgi:hypothetical protein
VADFVSRLSRSLAPGAGQSVVALSIDGGDARLICVKDGEIWRMASPSLAALMHDGAVADPGAFGAELRRIFTDYEIPDAGVVAGFPDPFARSAIVTLPTASLPEIEGMLRLQLGREWSETAGEGRLFLRTIRQTGSETTVFGLMVRKVGLDRYLQALSVAGIRPRQVELRALAMTRAVNLPYVVIVNVERTELDIVIVNGNLPMVMHSAVLSEGGAVKQAVLELANVVNAYRQDQPDTGKLKMPAVLMGALCEEPELRQILREKLGLSVEALACPFKAPPGFAVANFAVGIGLALKVAA